MNTSKVRTIFFDLRQLFVLIETGDGYMINTMSVSPPLSPKPGRRHPDSVAEPCVKVCLHTALSNPVLVMHTIGGPPPFSCRGNADGVIASCSQHPSCHVL